MSERRPRRLSGLTVRSGRHARRRGWRRVGLVTAVILLVVLLAGGVAAGLLLWRGEASLDRLQVGGLRDRFDGGGSQGDDEGDGLAGEPSEEADEAGQAQSEEPAQRLVREPFVALVTGVDGDLSGLTEEQRDRVALGGDRDGMRPDTIILLRVDPAADQVALLSLPRDLLVRRCDGSLGKINGAYNVGTELEGTTGPSCLVTTITRHTGIGITYYVEVSFAGFLDVVDAIGGVRMHIPDRLVDGDAKLDLQPGCQVLDGPESLAYVRARGFDNDFGRMARQQAFARELLDEVTSAGTLANPVRMFRLVDAAASAVDVSENLGYGDMRAIASSLTNLDSERLATEAVTGEIVFRDDLGGAAVVEENRSVTEPLYRAFREGRLTEGLPSSESPDDGATPEPSAEASIAILPDDEVPPVRVLNAVGESGLASRAAELLEQRGLEVGDVGDAPLRHSRSVIQHGPGLEREAETVAQALGGLPTRERLDLRGAGSSEGGEVLAVVGADLVDLDVPDVRGTPQPSGPSSQGSAGASDPAAIPSTPTPEYVGVPSGEEAC